MAVNIKLEALNLNKILSMTDSDINCYEDHRKYSALMVAAKAGHKNAVNNLISRDQRVDFEVNGESAVSLAYARGHLDVVLALLMANSKFPRNFQAVIVSDELKAFVDLSHEMHERISQGDDDDEDLKNFLSLNIKANPNLNYFYDTKNCSLIMRAFEARKFKTLKLLWDLDLKLAPHEEIWSTFAKFSFNEKEKFTKLYLSIFDKFSELPDREVTQFKDFRGFNALMIAVEFNYIEEAKYCIEKGFFILDATFNGFTAASLAFSYRHFEILLILLKANAEFPDNFDPNIESLTEELKSFVEVSNAIHNHIESNDAEKVEEIIGGYPNLNFFYDLQNRSAFRHAIESKKFEIYKLLSKNFITFGSNENFSEMKEVLTKAERSELKRIQFELAEPLISQTGLTLVSHSFIGYDSKNKRREVVMEAFNFLLKHHRTKKLLKIVATQKNYQIVFDFTRDSIEFLDPNSGIYARGAFEFSGRIYIAAKKLFDETEKFRVIGTLAHELCHFAMLVTFKNSAEPYKVKDEVRRKDFHVIINKYEKLVKSKGIIEEIITNVFCAYDSTVWAAELIVRPVQIDVQYNEREELRQKQENFKELYNFYDGHCMPEMENILPKLEAKANITENKIQNYFGLLIFITLLVFSGFSAYYFYDPQTKWNDLSHEKQDFIKSSKVNYYCTDVKFGELFKNDSKVFDLLSSEQIKEALNNKTEELSKALKNSFKPYIYLTWSNMTEKLKNKFLMLKVDFQGQKVPLEKITKNSSFLELLSALQINEIFSGVFKIGSIVEENSKIHIERFFTAETSEIVSESFLKSETNLPHFYKDGKINIENSNVINFDKVVKTIECSKNFILSSMFGHSKSTVFRLLTRKIKEELPLKWVEFVDLKQQITSQNIFSKNFKPIASFLGENILNLTNFKLKIFKNFYETGNVIFLWDNIDEIAPKFKDFMLDLTKNISRKKNFQFISTRPQYSKEFEEQFSVRAYKLIPFSELDRFEFIIKTIADKKFNENGNEIFEKLKNFYNQNPEEYAKKFNDSNISKYFQTLQRAHKIFKLIDTLASANIKQSRLISSNPFIISNVLDICYKENFDFEKAPSYSQQLYDEFLEEAN